MGTGKVKRSLGVISISFGCLDGIKIDMLSCQLQAVLGAEQGSETERGMVGRHFIGVI